MRIFAAIALAACCVGCLDERLPSGAFAAQTAAALPDAGDGAGGSGDVGDHDGDAADSVAADSVAADSVAVDSVAVDTGGADAGADTGGRGPCTSGTASEECNDGNPCTTDSCINGACSHAGLTLVPCTQGGKTGTCNNGVCS